MDGPARPLAFVLTLLATSALPAAAQTLPTSEPEILVITRERIRPGYEATHVVTESQRVAAFERANAPDYYLAMTSITGAPETWFVQPWFTYADWERAETRHGADPTLAGTLTRVNREDGAHVEARRIVEAVAMPTLGHGTVPNLNLVRFWRVTTLWVRPGYEDAFATTVQTYRGVVSRSDPDASWRVYKVTNGMPLGTYLVFSSVESFTQFDGQADSNDAVNAAMTEAERRTLREFSADGLRRGSSNRFRLDPQMSFVSAETRALDPAFWRGRH